MNRNNPVNLPLLRQVMEYNFAVLETVLYLNTHPEDNTVLNLHNRFAREYMNLVKDYQRNYGLLFADYPNAELPWQWIDEPWPWEIEY
ncbi:MAG: spore coat protein CotJB [Halanaerobiaceae bacterium]